MLKLTRSRALLLVFLAVFVVHARCDVTNSGDSRWFIPTALSIIHHGDVDLDEYDVLIQSDSGCGLEKVDGHYYNYFPIGTALASLPFVGAMDLALDTMMGVTLETCFKRRWCRQAERFIASLFVALAAVLMFLIAECGLGNKAGPLLVAGVFAFGTSAWSTASRALWQHGPSMLMLAASLYLLLRTEGKESRVVFLGPLLAFAYLIRPTNLISYVLLMGVVFLRHRRYFCCAVLLSMLVFGPFVALNLSIYGDVLPPYCQSDRLAFGAYFPEALAGNLVSPSRGLFIFSPVLLLSFFGAYLKLRRRSFRILDGALVVIVILHWIAISMFPWWWGGHCIGPRFFTDMTPYFVYFLIPVVDEIRLSRGFRCLAIAAAFSFLSGISFHAHCRGAVKWCVSGWNVTPLSVDAFPARVWDWSDIQFMREE